MGNGVLVLAVALTSLLYLCITKALLAFRCRCSLSDHTNNAESDESSLLLDQESDVQPGLRRSATLDHIGSTSAAANCALLVSALLTVVWVDGPIQTGLDNKSFVSLVSLSASLAAWTIVAMNLFGVANQSSAIAEAQDAEFRDGQFLTSQSANWTVLLLLPFYTLNMINGALVWALFRDGDEQGSRPVLSRAPQIFFVFQILVPLLLLALEGLQRSMPHIDAHRSSPLGQTTGDEHSSEKLKEPFPSPEQKASLLSVLTMSWLDPLIYLGNHRPLNESDVWDLEDGDHSRLVYRKYLELRYGLS
ncbi:hypothetical protein BJ742DRAFT_423342 [Cladochytrium replicatum]|nr:hypothetical protein BJ742DRAFT_423342 [Cladochytrium replicatum]